MSQVRDLRGQAYPTIGTLNNVQIATNLCPEPNTRNVHTVIAVRELACVAGHYSGVETA